MPEELLKSKIKQSKLIKDHQNNLEISKKNLPNKFEKFEENVLKESKTLLYETIVKPTNFKRYARGCIVKVKFGVNIGSEFSGDHFAIVVSKKDTMKNPVLHVIPITSKAHIKNVEIGSILYNKNELIKLSQQIELSNDKKEIKKINQCMKYYQNRKNKISYACVDHLKTISKLSILKPINEFDYLPNLRCSQEIMKQIDEAIINEYTI